MERPLQVFEAAKIDLAVIYCKMLAVVERSLARRTGGRLY